ncbi:ABC transporter permease [Ekhidna sp.]|uniref:ABC transporter permease n=1 Tax=Ekhidna sp. TaxID=2608089 RepID=UPI0032EE338B
MNLRPPKYADRFLEWFCDPYLVEDLQGDLYEIYLKKHQRGKLIADIHYWWLVIRSFRISALKPNRKLKNHGLMITKNNFKIAWRVLLRDKFNTAINLLGLTIGITCFLLLGLYVKQELSYDQFHAKKDRIYRLVLNEDYGDGRTFYNSTTPLRFESMLEENFPEVARGVQYIRRTHLVGRGEKRINEPVAVISQDFFKMFDFELLIGNKEEPFSSKSGVLLSREYAQKYFGEIDPIGKSLALQINEEIRDFVVEGVFEDIPKESSIQFDIALSSEMQSDLYSERAFTAWFNIIPETYILLDEGVDPASLNEKIQDLIMSFMADMDMGGEPIQRGQYNIEFQPLTDIHLNPNVPLGYAPVGNPQYVAILGAIGLLVIIIACMNYATLSIGQSLKRAKEVGVRKVLGAFGRSLTTQYLVEGILLTLIAMTIGVLLAFLMVPTFNRLTGTDLVIEFEWWHVLVYLSLALFIGFTSSFYPAWIQSKFKAISVLHGGSQSTDKVKARKGMIVFQFIITVFLISTSLLIRKQVNYLQNKDLGIQYDAVVSARLNPSPEAQRIPELTSTAMHNGELLKARLEKYPEITQIGMGSHVFGSNGWAHYGFNDKDGNFKRFRLLVADPAYLSLFDIEAKEGRLFEQGNTLDERQGVLLNPAAVTLLGLENPVGGQLPNDEFGDHQILGVTEEFHFSSLHSSIEPLVIVQNPIPILMGISDLDINDSFIPKLVFRYNGSNLLKATEILQQEWESVFPNESWNYEFVDERIKSQYESEARMNKLITVATFLSIIIAALGLLGLSLLVVNSKVKEIGIRKVMGASPISIFGLLAKGFSIQITIAIILSIPLTILLMNRWLDNFAYRTEIGAGLFVLSALTSIIVAGAVISYQTMRASKVNPVESLRAE